MNSLRRGTLWARIRDRLQERVAQAAVTFLDDQLASKSYSGGQLLERVNDLGNELQKMHLAGRGPIGILSSSQETQLVHFLAALSVGLPPAILTPPNRKLHLAHYLEMIQGVSRHCQFAAIISDLEIPEVEVTRVEPWTLRVQQSNPAPVFADTGEASFLQFSSGTTGIKRGVLVNDTSVLAQIDSYSQALGLSPADVVVGWLPLYHDMGLIACMMMPLVQGIHSVMLHPLDWVARPSLYLRAVTAYRGTLSWHPNFAYAFQAQRVSPEECAGVDLTSLRALVNCSEPVTDESQNRFLERFTPYGLRPDVFCGCYAMAETTFALTHGRSSDVGYQDSIGPALPQLGGSTLPSVSVGRPLPGVQIEIVDEQGGILPERRTGEIRVRSPFNFDGYYNNPEATSAVIVEGWYYTGDLGYRIGEELFVSGRKKDLLIVGGVNVWPQDLENLVCEAQGIHAGRAVAFANFDPLCQTEKVVVLAETNVSAAQKRALAITLRQRILAALQIANFEVHLVEPGWLLKSSSGKMARAKNRERWVAEQSQKTPELAAKG